MKTLYLVRHAKSSWKFSHLADIERPLNKRGEADAPKMGQHLRQQKIFPSTLISSPANRAFTTARIIAKKIGFDLDRIEVHENLYHAYVDELLAIVNQIDDHHSSAMLFGHNPGFTDFANQLANEYIENIPTCGVVCLAFDFESWAEVEFTSGDMTFFVYPKGL